MTAGNVTINGNTVSLGNVGAAGTVCATCDAGTGHLAINAGTILFTGGAVATKASTLTTSVPVTLAADVTVILRLGRWLRANRLPPIRRWLCRLALR